MELIPEQNIEVIEKNCFDVKLEDDIDIFFYDGPHDYASQKNALKHFYQNMNETFIYIADDFNEFEVNKGTMDAIKELDLQIRFMSFLPSRHNCDQEYYWNGLGIFKLQK